VKLANFALSGAWNQEGAETSLLHANRKAGSSFRLALFGEAAQCLR